MSTTLSATATTTTARGCGQPGRPGPLRSPIAGSAHWNAAVQILANARLTWRNEDDDLEISAEVTNLFDKYYLLTVFDLTLAGTGWATGQPGRPREWALTVKKRF